MSLSRRNWSALSSLAKQWTLEDEEEIVREQRRKSRNQSSSSSTTIDLPTSRPTEVDQLDAGGALEKGQRSSNHVLGFEQPTLERVQKIVEPEPQEILGPDDDETKFLEILKSRENRRQRRQVEILESIKQEQQNDRRKENNECDPRTAGPPQQINHATKSNTENGEGHLKMDKAPELADQASKYKKDSRDGGPRMIAELSRPANDNAVGKKVRQESGPRMPEPPQQSNQASKWKKKRDIDDAEIIAESTPPPGLDTKGKKEREESEPGTSDLAFQPNHIVKCTKESGATPSSQGTATKESTVASQTTTEDRRRAGRSCLKMSKAAPTKPGGLTSTVIDPVTTSLAAPVKAARSSSPTRSNSPSRSNSVCSSNSGNAPSSNSGTNNIDGASSHNRSSGHASPSHHDQAKKCDATKTLNSPTSREEPAIHRRPASVSSSVTLSLPKRQAEAKSLPGPIVNTLSNDSSSPGNVLNRSISATGLNSPAGLTSPTSISITPSPTHKSQVFVSAIKISRNSSFDDTDGKKDRKLVKQRSVEKIKESKSEAQGLSPFPERSVVEEEEKTVPRNKTRHTILLHLSTSGDDWKLSTMGDGLQQSESGEETKDIGMIASEGPADSGVTSPDTTASGTGLRRFSPRTTSFRVMNQTEQSGSPFNRSASLRIPSRSFKLDATLEKYASALQKSETVKSPTRTKEFFPIPEGVASKRSVFEREAGGSGASTPTSKKGSSNLTVAVSSRINQWISKTQGDESKNSGAKDAKKVDIASKRSLWEQRSMSTETKP
ncbi:ladinin-1 [Ambystoma mexicanum]|uniref:ladinin-1 n=1 Tax=Ambystoma mexicanum TaxID=8296 RepID=UPI0037E962C7